MPRKYQRVPGSRNYRDYSNSKLEEALNAVKDGMSHRKAALTYGICRKTIFNKLKARHVEKPGRPAIFNPEEEKAFESCLLVLSDNGFPLTPQDLQTYLNKCRRVVKALKNNKPGRDWVDNFLQRHPILNKRFASNIKKCRAAIDVDVVEGYIQHLSKELNGVPPGNIINFDETNLTDDPGKSKVISKRGQKYIEKIINSSKSSVSLMMCGTASGDLLPPYVVYKSTQMWSSWKEGGPQKCRYSNSPSGWFDGATFTDWIETVLVPFLKNKEGHKIVLCDNLSTHVSVHIVRMLEEYNTKLVCLPPNSTHLTQPLDVAFFGPTKRLWRGILLEYKESVTSGKSGNLQKQHVPHLLKLLMERLLKNAKDNLKAGFKKCGIYPVSAEPLLDRLKRRVYQEIVNESFAHAIEQKRTQWVEVPQKKRRKRVNVVPGKSVSEEDFVPREATSVQNQACFPADDTDDEDFHALSARMEEEELEEEAFTAVLEGQPITEKPKWQDVKRQAGEHAIFNYEGEVFPGVITICEGKGAYISAMTKSLKSWKWPAQKDEIFYEWDEVIGSIKPPKAINKRGCFMIPQLEGVWGIA